MIEPAEVRCLISELRGGNGGICGVGLWAGNVMESLLREWEAARAVNRQFEERVAVLMSSRAKEAQTADAMIGLEKLARDELERFKKDWSVLRSESGVLDRENKNLRADLERAERERDAYRARLEKRDKPDGRPWPWND